ncbi:uncharacterized protein LOC144112717 isoform X3 [Amblyomma americanum]
MQHAALPCFIDQGRYPFCFTRKEEETSWRSSIRHALFQRWFVKVQPFTTDQNSGGGRNNFRAKTNTDKRGGTTKRRHESAVFLS